MKNSFHVKQRFLFYLASKSYTYYEYDYCYDIINCGIRGVLKKYETFGSQKCIYGFGNPKH